MNMRTATGPLILGLCLAATLSACGNNRISPEDYAKTRVPQLIASLHSDKPDVRCQAAFGLGKIARYAEAAIPALTCSLSDPASEVRDMAEWALCQICNQGGKRLAMAGTPALRARKAGNP